MSEHIKAPGPALPIPVDEDGNRLCPQCGDLLVEIRPNRWQCATWAEIDRVIFSQLQQALADQSEQEAERIRQQFGGAEAVREFLEGDR